METASRYGSKPNAYSSPIAQDVSIEVTMDGEGPRMGGDAELTIVMRNASSLPRTINLHSQVAVMYYTGVVKATVKKDQIPVELLPNEGEPLGNVLCYVYQGCSVRQCYSLHVQVFLTLVLPPSPNSEEPGVDPSVPELPGPACGPGCSDADPVGQGQ